MQRDLAALNDRLIYLENQNAQLRERSELLRKNTDQVKSRIDEKADSLQTQSAGLQARFNNIREEIQSLNGRIEENEHRVERLSAQLAKSEGDRVSEFTGRLERLEQYLNFDAPVITGSSGKAPVVKSTGQVRTAPFSSTSPRQNRVEPYAGSVVTGTDSDVKALEDQAGKLFTETELYELAKQAFDQGDYDNAHEGFLTLLKKFPRSRYADNAQFWIGEIYYRKKDYKKAIIAYTEVIENFPNGNKVKNAILKQAFSFYNLKDMVSAKAILQDLIVRFPDSNEAGIARKKLSGM